jgi:hypothetical protein
MGKQRYGYWIGKPPPSGNTKGWLLMRHGTVITDAVSPDQWDKLIEKYNARVDAYNKAVRDGTPNTHPEVTGATFCGGQGETSFVTTNWIVDISFVRGFIWWPGHWTLVTDQATIKRENIKRLTLHWRDGAQSEFCEWLEAPTTIEPRKQP